MSSEFQVPYVTYGNQWNANVATLLDGSFIITWYSRSSNNANIYFYGQKYHANGEKVGDQFQVAAGPTLYTIRPTDYVVVPSSIDENFFVLWRQNSTTLKGQFFDVNTEKLSDEFSINHTEVTQNLDNFTAHRLSDGSLIVLWLSKEDETSASGNLGIFAQRFDHDGKAIGSEFLINNASPLDDRNPTITELQNGSFVAAWEYPAGSGGHFGIQAKIFNNLGSTDGVQFKIDTEETKFNSKEPDITALENGNFIVSWQSFDWTDRNDVMAKIYNSSAIPVTPEFKVNTFLEGEQVEPNLLPLNDNSFLAFWTGSSGQDGSNLGIFGRKFNQYGSPVGDEFLINTYTSLSQSTPSAAALQDGGFIITWESYGQDPTDGGTGVFAQRFNSEASRVAIHNSMPTGGVTITGLAIQGEALTTNTFTLVDADALGALVYQWKADGANISNATNSTLTLSQDEVGKAISVTVSYTDGGGTVESVTSAPSSTVTNVNDDPTGSVTISGTAAEDQTLTLSSTVADEDGIDASTVSYQWYRDGSAISGATDTSYTLTQNDVDAAITAKQSYTDDFGNDHSVTSTATNVVSNVNDDPTGSVTISGTANQGSELTAVTATLADEDGLGALSYQWLRDGSEISNATSSTYTLIQDDVGAQIFARVSYTDGYGTQEAVTSVATAIIEPSDVSVDGIVSSPAEAALDNITLTMSSDELPSDLTVTSGSDGVFEFTTEPLSAGLVTADKPIDAASEEAIGAYDALQALRLAVGLTKSDGTAEWHDYLAADINKDGRVGADDALDILKYAVGLTDGSSADWIFVEGDADWSGIDRRNTSYDEGVMLEDVLVDTSISMTGILVGDLDGSYVS